MSSPPSGPAPKRPNPLTSRRGIAVLVALAAMALAPSMCSDPLSQVRSLLAKAEPDECYAGLGEPYPAGPPCPAGSQPKVNQSYVFGLTDAGDELWFGTSANQLCTVVGTVLEVLGDIGIPFDPTTENEAWVCEYGLSDFRNQFEPIPEAGFDRLPESLGDWRPPKIYSYDLTNGTLVDRTPDDPLIDNTLGIRSAGAIGDLAILGGPNLEAGFLAEGGAINLFAFDTSTGEYLGSAVLEEFTNIRKWVVVDGVLYTGVRAASDGRVLRWNGSVDDPFQYEVVGILGEEAVELAEHEGRLFVTTWWLQLGEEIAGLWMSPTIPQGGLTTADQNAWTKVWAASDYEPDEAIAYSYFGGALASFDGYLYWGTINFPMVSFGAHVLLRDVLAEDPLDLLPALGASLRSIVVMRGRNFASADPEMETLYGEEELPAYEDGSWRLEPTGMGPPRYGHSGFGNPFNAYTWNMTVKGEELFVGTMDWTFMFEVVVRSIAEMLGVPEADVLDELPPVPTAGADLFRFVDAETAAVPESFSGVGNAANYGVRTSAAVGDAFYIGTANAMNLLTDPDDGLPEGGWELLELTQPVDSNGDPIVVGDVDGSGRVGPNDVELVSQAVGQDPSGQDDARDVNRDGAIDEVDVLQTALLCTECADSTWLVPSRPSPSPVGELVIWTAIDGGPFPTTKRYRFSAVAPDGSRQILRDYDRPPAFEWAPLVDGSWRIEVEVRNATTGEDRQASRNYDVSSKASSGAVVSETLNPLVALYSAPPCPVGRNVRVHFRPPVPEGGSWSTTPPVRCGGIRSSNVLVAGLRPVSVYEMRHQVDGEAPSDPIPFTTGAPALGFPDFVVRQLDGDAASVTDDVVLHAMLIGGPQLLACPVATDLAGNVIWHYPRPCLPWNIGSMLPRPVPGGGMLLTMSRGFVRGQLLREIDLAGHTLRETNVERVNEQLEELGHDRINLFHHEALRLANGHTLVLAGVEKLVDQGDGVENVVGDMVIDLDRDLQVVWAWNAFEKLDVTRKALLDETCGGSGILGVCGPLYLADDANDWTHANAITHLADGHILVSMRHQDWVIKIDYANGRGSGDVLWRLGNDGDFGLIQGQPGPQSPSPWFSHQHQPEVYRDEIVIYDNSNLRRETNPRAHSRGQSYRIDESAMTAELVLNADLGVYSAFLGSAQKLANGNYHFLSGGIGGGDDTGTSPGIPQGFSQSTEVDPEGRRVYVLEGDATTYRSFRMDDMYTPAAPRTPLEGCHGARGQRLAMKARNGAMNWSWRRGRVTGPFDFGDPLDGTDYRLCVFDGLDGAHEAVSCTEIPGGEGWRVHRTGFRYRDRDPVHGLRRIRLVLRPNGSDLLSVRGRGADMPEMPMRKEPSVVAQFSSSTTGACWETLHPEVAVNHERRFRAR